MRHTARGRARDSGDGRPAVLVATEVVLLWPRAIGSPATVDEAGRWPVFVLVVGDRTRSDVPSAVPLLDLVDHPRHANEPAAVAVSCRWSVVDARNALLRAAVRAEGPVPFAVEILVPARHVLGVLDVAARGATIGLTTARHSAKLSGRVDIRRVLQCVVLLSCGPSAELARLAGLLESIVEPG
jgi:hypothetical protein